MPTIAQKARAFDTIRLLLGYFENGSGTVVKIYQDDATTDWFVCVGKERWFDPSLYGALQKARADLLEKEIY